MTFIKSGRRLALGLAAALAFAAPALAQSYDGDWAGALSAGGQTLHLVLHVKTENGQATAVLNSLDQGASIPASAVKTEGGQVSILFMQVGGEFVGRLSDDGKTLTGSWSQGATMPPTLTKK
ncbi:hypothetical protein [Phenylobacterium sp.]|uniref:hypothetical protein n=1 Tax=Phenylobacterium sp. TaxID=1871053 RepID=UPI0011F906EF|nr:hypothetical protein [Phenylobacterium sp.]THD62811.1 MAG: hypothetical protein E8A49_06770 [Phenylobacterium sp.]